MPQWNDVVTPRTLQYNVSKISGNALEIYQLKKILKITAVIYYCGTLHLERRVILNSLPPCLPASLPPSPYNDAGEVCMPLEYAGSKCLIVAFNRQWMLQVKQRHNFEMVDQILQ